jgi:hypothetical protein
MGWLSEFPPLTPPIDTSRPPPFHEMNEHPKRFERMSAQLLGREPSVEGVELYGIDGQRQCGIDILAKRRASDEVEVASCKCYQTVRPSDIPKWSDDFLDHWSDYWSPPEGSTLHSYHRGAQHNERTQVH